MDKSKVDAIKEVVELLEDIFSTLTQSYNNLLTSPVFSEDKINKSELTEEQSRLLNHLIYYPIVELYKQLDTGDVQVASELLGLFNTSYSIYINKEANSLKGVGKDDDIISNADL